MATQPQVFQDVDVSKLAEATDGFTGADLNRTIEDGKSLYAYASASSNGSNHAAMTDYFLRAVETVRESRRRYIEAEAQARSNRSVRPAWFSVPYECATNCDD